MLVKEWAEQRRHVRYLSSILFAFDVLPGSIHWCCCWKERQRQHVRYLSSILFAYDIHYLLNPDPDTDLIWIRGFDDQKLKKKKYRFDQKCNLLMSKLQESLHPSKENIQHFKK
jgi:hypothetical protein